MDALQEKFPTISKKDLKRVCQYGSKQLYLLNSYGGDVFLKDKDFWCYIGFLGKSALAHFAYYKRKLSTKLRVLSKRKKIEWDGYYYFGLTENQYQEYVSQQKHRGRPRKKYTFHKVFLYKLLDECKIKEHCATRIFRIPYNSEIGFCYYKPELVTDKAELIITRQPAKFQDILTSTNDYYICSKKP